MAVTTTAIPNHSSAVLRSLLSPRNTAPSRGPIRNLPRDSKAKKAVTQIASSMKNVSSCAACTKLHIGFKHPKSPHRGSKTANVRASYAVHSILRHSSGLDSPAQAASMILGGSGLADRWSDSVKLTEGPLLAASNHLATIRH